MLGNYSIKLNATKKYGYWLLKFVVFLILIGLIYQQITKQKELGAIWLAFVQAFSWQNSFYLGIVLIGMVFQWSLEAWKWRYLIQKIERLSFWRALQAILYGVTLSLFTPNRVGEFGGRVLILKNAPKLQAIAVTLIGSLSQLIVYITLGLLAISIFFTYYLPDLAVSWAYSIVCFSGLTVVLATWMYFNLAKVYHFLGMIPWLQKWQPSLQPIIQYDKKALCYILYLSLVRYLFINLQFIALLHFFGITISWFTGLVMVNSIFLVQTILPSIALVELGVRGHVALFFLQYITSNTFSIIAATFTLWFINLVLPALSGALLGLWARFDR